jgi:hypothetical protein
MRVTVKPLKKSRMSFSVAQKGIPRIMIVRSLIEGSGVWAVAGLRGAEELLLLLLLPMVVVEGRKECQNDGEGERERGREGGEKAGRCGGEAEGSRGRGRGVLGHDVGGVNEKTGMGTIQVTKTKETQKQTRKKRPRNRGRGTKETWLCWNR